MKHIKPFDESYGIPKPVRGPKEQGKIGIPKPVRGPKEQGKIGIPRKVNSNWNSIESTYNRDEVIEELINSTDIKGFLLSFKDELISDLRDLYNQLDDDYLKAAYYINQLSDDDFSSLEDDDFDMENYLNHSANLAHELQELNNKYLAKLKLGKP